MPSVVVGGKVVPLQEQIAVPPIGVFPDGLLLNVQDVEGLSVAPLAFYVGQSDEHTIAVAVETANTEYGERIEGIHNITTANVHEREELGIREESTLHHDLADATYARRRRLDQSTFSYCRDPDLISQQIADGVVQTAYNHAAVHFAEMSRRTQEHERAMRDSGLKAYGQAVAAMSDMLFEQTEMHYVAVGDNIVSCARTWDHEIDINAHIEDAHGTTLYEKDERFRKGDSAPFGCLAEMGNGGVAFIADEGAGTVGSGAQIRLAAMDDIEDHVKGDVLVVNESKVKELENDPARIETEAKAAARKIEAHEDARLWMLQVVGKIEPDGAMRMTTLTKGETVDLDGADDRETLTKAARRHIQTHEKEIRLANRGSQRSEGVQR